MKTISRVFSYVYHFLTAETKELRIEAFKAAQKYYASRPLLSSSNPHPTPIAYERRRLEFSAFQRGYKNARCHEVAKAKLTTNR